MSIGRPWTQQCFWHLLAICSCTVPSCAQGGRHKRHPLINYTWKSEVHESIGRMKQEDARRTTETYQRKGRCTPSNVLHEMPLYHPQVLTAQLVPIHLRSHSPFNAGLHLPALLLQIKPQHVLSFKGFFPQVQSAPSPKLVALPTTHSRELHLSASSKRIR